MPSPSRPSDLLLPEYEDDSGSPLPLYSQTLGSSECLVQTEVPRRTNCAACEWIFPTKRARINLGRRTWKISGPAYGLNANIDGHVQWADKKHPLESVTATLEGRLKTSFPERIPSSDDSSSPFLSLTVPIYKADQDSSVDTSEIPFSIPFPSYLRYKGEETLCPPSFYHSDLHFLCEITYSIRFDISWRKKPRWKKTESRNIPIYYLPKTNPIVPPICVLPPASRHLENPPLFLQGPERMESFPIAPSFRSKSNPGYKPTRQQRLKLESYPDSVYLSLPVPASFTSGQDIPFMLSVSFRSEPYLAELLCKSPEVQLFKKVGFFRKPSPGEVGPAIERAALVSSATIRKTSGWAEGMIVLKGEIQAGDAGSEQSWVLRDSAYVQYVLRVTLRPPTSLSTHIPTFVHEAPIEICTSSWGSLDREMASSGGMTTPAVSLASSLRRLY
ncbi:hypothetical protein CC1G_05162 [Coprinopsis cinerea okayama7|uniref:Arrestin-like N-terminal domain-containing protein n=1 Tax=Coprinopsis cinerea (strain Okayama-7 / 130 / ATCC MYA-4618 / FGSC 9003) TaxID=240176 RepID=A8NG30_COPC7|nr:hypothetical protein CC1G_05162 [Coprinopsis cinerea okayama7\|eukprot:XP_001833462.2 hypothetical protein CC1G_05162 [Coprinopsis cinerea okayama7\